MADDTSPGNQGEHLRRYCPQCGEMFEAEPSCPNCHARWTPNPPADLHFLVRFLNELTDSRRRNLLDSATYQRIRQVYEERVLAIRPPRRRLPQPTARPVAAPVTATPMAPRMTPAAAHVAPAAATTMRAAIPPRAAIQPRPVAAPRPVAPPKPKPVRTKPPVDVNKLVRAWAAKRQADLLLYLGAFMLVIAAILFVNYGGGAAGVKSSFFAVYTIAFLVMGLSIRRWRRVQEASPVFTALGALLTPLNFVLLWVDVLGDREVPGEQVWLACSTTTAGLYLFLALRGYGRFYLIPGTLAALVAWGSLAATLQIGREWYGAWYASTATVINLLGCYRYRGHRRLTEWPAAVLGVPALGWAIACAVLASEQDYFRGELPITLAILIPGVFASAHRYNSVPAYFLLPALGAGTVGTSAWAAEVAHLGTGDWATLWVALTAVGYLGVGAVNRKRAVEWATLAATVAGAALVAAHVTAFAGGERAALPSTYAMVTAGAVAAWLTWRWLAAGVVLPPLLAATVATGLWAASLFPFEWTGCAIAAAGLGYLALVRIQPAHRSWWRGLALASAGLGIAGAHLAAEAHGIQGVELPVTYAVVLAGALWAGGVDRYDPALLLVPGAVTGLATSTLWVLDVPQAQWAWPALATAAALVLAEPWWRGRGLPGKAGWPSVLTLALAPVAVIGPFRHEPETAAGAFAAAALLWAGASVLARGALAALVTRKTGERTNVLEQRWLALGAGALALVSLAYVGRAFEWERLAVAWSYLVAGVACWLLVAATGRKAPALNGIFGPSGAAAVGIAVLVALGHSGQESMMLGAAALAATLAVQPGYLAGWRGLAALCGGGALLFGHAHASANGTDAWQLPAAYGFVLAAFAWDAVVSRNDYSWLGVPAAGGAGAGATLWFMGVPMEHWAWPAPGFALAIELTQPWWSRKPKIAGAGWPYAILGALVPLSFIGVYLHAPWAGAGALGAASVLWLVAAVFSNGAIVSAISGRAEARDAVLERRVLAWGAAALAMGSVAFVDKAFDWSFPESAWGFAGLAVAAWLASAALGRRAPELHGILGPAGAVSMAVAVATAFGHNGQEAVMLGAGALAATLAVQPGYLAGWRGLAALCGGAALAFGHAHAWANGTDAWQLPAAYGFVFAAFAWDAVVSRNDYSWLGVPVTASVGLASLLFILDVSAAHWAWPALGSAAVIEATEPWWRRRTALSSVGWPYALILAAVPLMFVRPYEHHSALAAGAFAAASLAWAVAAARARGGAVAVFLPNPPATAPRGERAVLGLASAALLFGAAAYFSRALELARNEAAWPYVAIGAVAWLAVAASRTRVRELNLILLVTGVAATCVATIVATGWSDKHLGEASLVVAVGTAGSAVAIYGVRRWPMGLLTATGTAGSLALLWAHTGWDTWSLALTYGGLATAATGALTLVRDWKQSERGTVVSLLSTLPWALAFVTVYIALGDRQRALTGSDVLVRTPEWATLVSLVSVAGVLLVAEGLRLHLKQLLAGGTLVLLLALELGIAMLEPSTAQAYTTPIGLYVMAAALYVRRSEPLFGAHMDRHEAMLFLGVALVILPGAADALSHTSIRWSLLLIGEAFVLLATGFLLAQRWLVAGGVVTLVGVAARFYTSGGYQPPFWLTLGVVGLLALAAGVVLLAAREWWDRTRDRVVHWWFGEEGPKDRGGRGGPVPPAPPVPPFGPVSHA